MNYIHRIFRDKDKNLIQSKQNLHIELNNNYLDSNIKLTITTYTILF